MPQATTPTQQSIINHAKLLKAANINVWFVVQIAWVRDLVVKDGMSATDGHAWTNALLK